MHPRAHPGFARGRLGLRDLVGVMDRHVVDAAAVDVELLAEVLQRHGAALDVPARVAPAPRRVPEHGLVPELGPREPQHEVVGVALALVHGDARPGAQVLPVEQREPAVAGELRDVEAEIAPGLVGVPARLETADEVDHVGDVFGGPADHVGHAAPEQAEVAEERPREEVGDLPDRAPLLTGALLHLVLAVVRVVGEVTDVGHVHHVTDRGAGVLERAAQDVLEDVGAEVPDVGVVVHGGAAAVHADLARFQRHERLDPPPHGVVQPHLHARLL